MSGETKMDGSTSPLSPEDWPFTPENPPIVHPGSLVAGALKTVWTTDDPTVTAPWRCRVFGHSYFCDELSASFDGPWRWEAECIRKGCSYVRIRPVKRPEDR